MAVLLRWEWALPSGEKIAGTLELPSRVESVYLGPRLVSRSPTGGKVDGHSVVPGSDVRVRFFHHDTPSAALTVDGSRIEPVLAPSAAELRGFGVRMALVPRWAAAFVLACLALPVVSLGGLVPAAIGIATASGCLAVAERRALGAAIRIAICAALTLGGWGCFVAVAAPRGMFKRMLSRSERPKPVLQAGVPCDVGGAAACFSDQALLVCNGGRWEIGALCTRCTKADAGSDQCDFAPARPGGPCSAAPVSQCAPNGRYTYRCVDGKYTDGDRCAHGCTQEGRFAVCR